MKAIHISQFGDRGRSSNRTCEIGQFCVSVRIRGFDAAQLVPREEHTEIELDSRMRTEQGIRTFRYESSV
jgi:hypothetical protein